MCNWAGECRTRWVISTSRGLVVSIDFEMRIYTVIRLLEWYSPISTWLPPDRPDVINVLDGFLETWLIFLGKNDSLCVRKTLFWRESILGRDPIRDLFWPLSNQFKYLRWCDMGRWARSVSSIFLAWFREMRCNSFLGSWSLFPWFKRND